MHKNVFKRSEERIVRPFLQGSGNKITTILLTLFLLCFLINACQKAKEPEQKKEGEVQKEEAKQQEPVTKEVPKTAELTLKTEVAKKEQLSPLERAKGREIIQDGQPIITWGSLKDLPTLDEVFPVVDRPPKEFAPLKGIKEIQLSETEERRKLRKNLKEEMFDKLTAVKSPDGNCIIEFYGGSLGNGKREDWLRSIDPETKKGLWKYDEPGLFAPEVRLDFPRNSEYFILTNLIYVSGKTGVKLFSCKKGYLKEIYVTEEDPAPIPIATITPNGKYILVITTTGKSKAFDLEGNMLWEKLISPYHGPLHPIYISQDSSCFVTFYDSPEIRILEEQRRAGAPEELRIVEIETGDTKYKKRFHANLGDVSMVTNTMEIRGITKDHIVGIWLMDGIGFVLDKTNPYGNTMVLFTKKDVFAFRIQSLGFTFSEDGRYVSANGKYYDMQPILSKAMEGEK
jgi:hypothetical protein